MTFLPILYSFRRCPYAMRARLALYHAKIDHEHREVDLKNKPKEMLEISPKGTVPVLQLPDGSVLEESLDIMEWALKSPLSSYLLQPLIEENDTTFKHALDRYKYPGRYPEEDNKDYRALCVQFIQKIEDHLEPYLHGSHPHFLDMAIFPFIRQFAMVNPEWFQEQPYPRVKVWLDLLITSQLFQQVMTSYSPWSSGDDPKIVRF